MTEEKTPRIDSELIDATDDKKTNIVNGFAKYLSENQDVMQKIGEGLKTFTGIVSHIAPAALKIFSDTALQMKRIHDKRQTMYPRIVDNLDYLASQSWFLSMNVGLADFENQALILDSIPNYQDRADLIDESFVIFYEDYFDCLASHLFETFPERAFAIKPAIEAHRREEYALSIPVFFAQADGILFSLTEKELFTSNGHISYFASSKLEKEDDTALWMSLLDNSAWKPLSVKRPMGWHTGERDKHSYNGLNRNTVMHGLDLHYATKINSYKAFSLLAHIASLGAVLESEEEMKELKKKIKDRWM